MSSNKLETLADCCLALASERELGDELATALVATALMATATMGSRSSNSESDVERSAGDGRWQMNIPDNIAWLEDLAMHSGQHGNAMQEQRLLTIAEWIIKADNLLGDQNEMLNKLQVRNDELMRECEHAAARLARHGV